jgi:hypothetical protein
MAGFALTSEEALRMGFQNLTDWVLRRVFSEKCRRFIIPVTIAWIVFGVAAFALFCRSGPFSSFLAFIAQGVILSFVHQKRCVPVSSGQRMLDQESFLHWFCGARRVCEWNAFLTAGMVRAIAGIWESLLFCEDGSPARSQTRMALDGNITGESTQ